MVEPKLFYGLQKMPFQKETQYSRPFRSADMKEIENRLNYLKKTHGIGTIIGNPGTGKTASLREFVKTLNPSLFKVIYIQISSVSVIEFLRLIAEELGLG